MKWMTPKRLRTWRAHGRYGSDQLLERGRGSLPADEPRKRDGSRRRSSAHRGETRPDAGALSPGPESVGRFYRTVGWETADQGSTTDAKLFEDLRECAREYVRDTRRRVRRHVPSQGSHLLDMGSGPIQYPEYLEYSSNFTWRHCVDLSPKAIELAEARLGDRGVYPICQADVRHG